VDGVTAVAGATTEPASAGRRAPFGDWWGTVWFALGTFAGAHLLSDNSFLTHLATGRLILQSGVPHADPYSFTIPGKAWVVQSWLFSIIDASLERWVGDWAIRLFLGLVVGCLLATLWRLSRPAKTLLGRVAITALVGAIGLGYWNERPQTLAFLLLALALVVVLEEHNPLWLIPIFAVWIDVHGSWPLGLVVVGLVALHQVMGRRRLDHRAWDVCAAAALGSLLGAAVSPFGIDLLTFTVKLLGHSDVLKYIIEWRRPALGDPATLVFIAEVLVVAWAMYRARAWSWSPLAVVMVVLAATSRRNIPVASIALLPVMAPLFAGVGTIAVGSPVARRRALTVALVMTVAIGAVVAATPNDYDLGPFPVAAVTWMQARHLVATPDVNVVAPDYAGNYLEWRYGPRARVFIDDRAELFTAQIVGDYAEGLLAGKRSWQTILNRYNSNIVLWPSNRLLARELAKSTDWRIIHTAGGWVVGCRVASDLC